MHRFYLYPTTYVIDFYSFRGKFINLNYSGNGYYIIFLSH